MLFRAPLTLQRAVLHSSVLPLSEWRNRKRHWGPDTWGDTKGALPISCRGGVDPWVHDSWPRALFPTHLPPTSPGHSQSRWPVGVTAYSIQIPYLPQGPDQDSLFPDQTLPLTFLVLCFPFALHGQIQYILAGSVIYCFMILQGRLHAFLPTTPPNSILGMWLALDKCFLTGCTIELCNLRASLGNIWLNMLIFQLRNWVPETCSDLSGYRAN